MPRHFEEALARAPEHGVAPFPADEVRGQLARVRTAMERDGIDLLYLTAGLSATIDTLMFHEDRAALASGFPRRLEALRP